MLANKIPPRPALHTYSFLLYIYSSAAAHQRAALSICPKFSANRRAQPMKFQRHNAIRDLLANSLVSNQDELRRKLRRRGFAVTQATLSRDIHELHLSKGPMGYSLPNGNGSYGGSATVEEDGSPSLVEMIASFGVRARQAMNQVVVATAMGGAQPVAAALDRQAWPEVVAPSPATTPF
jgi:transcriptional regulator of arginine metabolism